MFRGADRVEVVTFGVVVLLVPWLVVGGAATLTRLGGATVRRWAQTLVLATLVGLVAVHVLKRATNLRGAPLLVLAVAMAAGFGVAYWRFATIGLWARYSSVAPAMFLGLFVLSSPVSSLVFPNDAAVADVEGRGLPRHVLFVLFDELPTS